MEDKILVPSAPILVESTRSIGYSFNSALADILDNSLAKFSTKIDVLYYDNPDLYLAIIDNGIGMDFNELINAMRFGSQSSLLERTPNDLGRFGLGLKTASLSQCRKLTVISKKNYEINGTKWDLEHIIEKNDWALQILSKEAIESLPFFDEFNVNDSGTMVIWEEFDKIKKSSMTPKKAFSNLISEAQNHISLVFHRFLNGEVTKSKLKIRFNNRDINPIDPFLTHHAATQPLNKLQLNINDQIIEVKAYVLPYPSKLSAKDREKLGNIADLRRSQGLYIYRNKRLIIWGKWFGLIKNNELKKLARVKVDIPSNLDDIWDIDVKKSTASLPDALKKPLSDYVQKVAEKSENVYKFRGRKANNDNVVHIWDLITERDTFRYEINRNNPLIKELSKSLNDEASSDLETLLQIIEEMFPFEDMYVRMSGKENTNLKITQDDERIYEAGIRLLDIFKENGVSFEDAFKEISNMDLFMKNEKVINHLRSKNNYDK